MKATVSLLLFFFSFSLCAQNDLLLPVKVKGQWGYINDRAEMIIPPLYNYAVDFKGAYAVVKKGNVSGVIDRRGKEVIAPAWEAVQVLNDTLAGVRNGSLWAVVDMTGKPVLPPIAEFLETVAGNRVVYKVKNRVGLMDRNGDLLIPPLYDSIYELDRGYFITLLNGKRGICSLTGRELLAAENEEIIPYYDQLILYRKDSRWGCISRDGEKLVPPQWTEMNVLTGNFIKVRRGKAWECYSLAARAMSACSFQGISYLGDSLLLVEKENRLGIMNAKLNVVLPMQYLDITLINPAVFKISTGSKYGLASAVTGKLLMPAMADEISGLYHTNAFAFRTGEKWGLVNASGSTVVKPRFAEIQLYPCVARAFVKKGGEVTMLHFDGNGNLLNSEAYADLHVINVQKGATEAATSLVSSTIKMEKFQWFFSGALKKWGLKTTQNDSVVLAPIFKSVRVIPSLNITIVELSANDHFICIDRQCFSSGSYFGLYSNLTGKCITAPSFYALRLGDIYNATAGNSLVGIKEDGMVLIDPHTGKTSKACSFIDKFNGNRVRIIKGGNLTLVSQKDEETLCSLSEFFYSFNVKWRSADGVPIGFFNLSNKYIKAGRAAWGYMKPDLEQHFAEQPMDFLDIFKGAYAPFKTDQHWGAVDTLFREAITPVYNKVELVDASRGFFRLKKINKRYGYIGKEGNTVVEVKYSKVLNGSENRFPVRTGGRKWGYTDETGSMIIAAQFDDARPFSEGLAAVKKKGKWGYIDPGGAYVIPPQYEGAETFSEGKAAVKLKGKYGYIDQQGEQIIPFLFNQARPFYDGIAVVLKAAEYGLINESGQWVKKPFCKRMEHDPQSSSYLAGTGKKQVLLDSEGQAQAAYASISGFSGNLALVKKRNKFGYVNNAGKLVIPARYRYASPFKNGLARVRGENGYGYIDEAGQAVIPDTLNYCGDYNGTSAFVWKNGKAGLIDRNGSWLVQPKFTVISDFSEGKAIVQLGNRTQQYYMDVYGNVLFAKYFQKAKPFKEGMAWVMEDGKWLLLNASGQSTSIFQYDRVNSFEKGVAQVSSSAFYGLSMPGNRFLLDAHCEDIQLIREGLYRVTIGDKVGYFTSEQKWLWEVQR